MATWHGGRTDVRSTRPGRTAVNQPPVIPMARLAAPLGVGRSAPLLASGGSHRLDWLLCRSTLTVPPTRTQKVFALSACVMAAARLRQAGRWLGCADGKAWTDPQPTVTAATRQAASPAEKRCI